MADENNRPRQIERECVRVWLCRCKATGHYICDRPLSSCDAALSKCVGLDFLVSECEYIVTHCLTVNAGSAESAEISCTVNQLFVNSL